MNEVSLKGGGQDARNKKLPGAQFMNEVSLKGGRQGCLEYKKWGTCDGTPKIT